MVEVHRLGQARGAKEYKILCEVFSASPEELEYRIRRSVGLIKHRLVELGNPEILAPLPEQDIKPNYTLYRIEDNIPVGIDFYYSVATGKIECQTFVYYKEIV